MRVWFSEDGWDDHLHRAGDDQVVLEQVNTLIKDGPKNLFRGLGKPEPLKGDLSGWWSRRITGNHRLVYRMSGKAGTDQRIEVASCRYHYNN